MFIKLLLKTFKRTKPSSLYPPFLFFAPGIWTHLTAVYNGEEGVAAVYINGVKKLQTKEDKSAISWGTSILLGSLKNTLTGRMAGHLEGDIARSRLFNRQLTSAEITSLATECQFEPGGNFFACPFALPISWYLRVKKSYQRFVSR